MLVSLNTSKPAKIKNITLNPSFEKTETTAKSTQSAVSKFFSFDADSVVDKLTFFSGVGLLRAASKAPTYELTLICVFFALLQAKLLADRKESRKK